MRKLLLVAATCLPAWACATSGNLLVNGSFETGFTGWTLTGTYQSDSAATITYNSATAYPTGAYGEAVIVDNAAAPVFDAAGTHAAYFVDDFADETLTQTVALVGGMSYEFGFDAYLPANGYANAGDATFSAMFAGVTLADFKVSASPVTSWTHFSGVATPTTSGVSAFTFSFDTSAFPSKDVVIDRVYLATTSDVAAAVPEPETYALMLAGLAAIGVAVRRRKA